MRMGWRVRFRWCPAGVRIGLGCRGRDTGSNSPLPDRVVSCDIPALINRLRDLPAGTPACGHSLRAREAGPAKEGAQMLVAFLLLAGLLLWATGHMILR
jgi:hypothetical protein